MKIQSFMLLLIAAAFLSLAACKKDVDTGTIGSSNTLDPLLFGKWGWFSFYTRVFDEAGTEYETPPVFYYGRGDVYYEYLDDGTYNTISDDGIELPGHWTIKNGKLVQDGKTEYAYSFEENNHTLILKNVVYYSENATKYRREEYSRLSKDWLP